MTGKEKEVLETQRYKIESEDPLILSSYSGKLVGIAAQVMLDDMMKDKPNKNLQLSDIENMDDNDNLLLTASANYADEFDLDEWMVITVEKFKKMSTMLQEYTKGISWYFGTNEYLEFSSGKELLSCIKFKKITQEEASALNSVFGGSFDGGGGIFNHILNLNGEQDAEEERHHAQIMEERRLNIEFLKEFGWEITPNDNYGGSYSFKNSAGEESFHYNYLIKLLADYHRKLNNF